MEKKDVYEFEFEEITDVNVDNESFTVEDNKKAIQNATLDIEVVLDNKILTIKDVINMKSGDILWLKKTIDEPVYLTSNGKKIAEAETTKVNNSLAVKILNL